MYDFDHGLFLALNFDGGPTVDRMMQTLSGTPMWIPLYGLIIALVWRRYGVRNTLEQDFYGTLKALADMGYEYVEFAGYCGKSG